ncbi:hypothetical protein [Streptomyces jumonjinensis]|uniref:Uncharacterized protein n=1 Tax=Streptomyces jumonjinensis TaxID=1945 RepID=A0A646KAN4_STRJU|nr:hypothetical protein [Streptomyces jumonjinensis]MQS99233.1 hypothetical protein [Streptomyces jumonjinensis]
MTNNSALEVGTLALDSVTRRIGTVMGHVGPYVQLRPPGGGLEWDASPENVQPADASDRLRKRLAERNANSVRAL